MGRGDRPGGEIRPMDALGLTMIEWVNRHIENNFGQGEVATKDLETTNGCFDEQISGTRNGRLSARKGGTHKVMTMGNVDW